MGGAAKVNTGLADKLVAGDAPVMPDVVRNG